LGNLKNYVPILESPIHSLYQNMKLKSLIGKEIEDIRVIVKYESYGLDFADSFIVLKGNIVIGIPWIDGEESIENEDDLIWERTLPPEASSIFEGKGNEKLKKLKGKKIINCLYYTDSENGFIQAEKAFFELEEEKFITEITAAPNGTGHAGLWVFYSKEELEKRYGTNYRRLNE